jgi:hypothetical protein
VSQFPFDPADDFLNFDGLETISYLVRLTGETFAQFDNVRALKHRPDFTEPELTGETPAKFHIAAKQLPTPLKPRDELIDAVGVRWVVVAAELQSFSSRYSIDVKKSRGVSLNVTILDTLTDNTGLLSPTNPATFF